MRKQLAAAVALALFGCAAPVLAASGGEPKTAVNTASYALVVKAGVVTRLEIHLKSGGLIVADQFTNDKNELGSEAVGLKDTCTTAACRTTCECAASARPFRSLARFDASGHQLWRWQAGGKLAGATLQAATDADCVSPSDKYLLVQGRSHFDDDEDSNEMVGVFDLITGRFRSVGDFSSFDAIAGWRRGAPSTVIAYLHDGSSDTDGSLSQTRLP